MAQLYVVYAVNAKTSKYGNEIYEISIIGTEDRCLYKTYIDAMNRNYANWADIIAEPNQGYILKNIKRRGLKDNKYLIDADSCPQLAWVTEHKQEVLDELVDNWLERDKEVRYVR
jgi:hypothetical protein